MRVVRSDLIVATKVLISAAGSAKRDFRWTSLERRWRRREVEVMEVLMEVARVWKWERWERAWLVVREY